MAKYRLMTMVTAKDGDDAALNDWYENQHVPDLLKVPGVVAAQRFRVHDSALPQPAWRYISIFELDVDDPATVMAEIGKRSGTDQMPLKMVFELQSMALYEAISPRRTA
jgi:hypothetical protein